MRIRKPLLILYLLPFCLSAPAQVKFSTVIDQKEISKGDYLQVEYMVENAKSVDQITPPSFEGFSIASGPEQQSSMSVMNGVVSKSEGISFILKPTATGRFTIPGAKALVDGRQMQSNSVVVHVTNGPPHRRPGGPQSMPGLSPFSMLMPEEEPEVNEEYLLRPGEKAVDKIKNNLFVKLDVSKTSCYIGEPLIATYKLCSRLKSESRVTKRPSLDGFSVYDMVQPETNSPTVEKINGNEFNVHIIRKVQLYPLQDGSFVLDPTDVDNVVHFIRMSSQGGKNSRQRMLDDYMNDMTVGQPEEQRIALSTKPLTITVKPLPAAGKPLFFDGAVGKFTISATLDSVSLGANEIARLRVLVKGDGNLPLINAPQVDWPQGIDLYDPAVKEDDDKAVCPISGTKEFDYSFSVKQPGRVIIPPVSFAYFDPRANAYKTLHTDSIVLIVTKSNIAPRHKAATDSTEAAGAAGNDTGSDNSKLLLYLPMAMLLAVVGVIALRKRRQKAAIPPAPPPVAPVPTRPVMDTDPLEEAKYALSEGNSQLFYKETGKAIWNTLARQLQLGSSQLNKPAVVRLLQEKGVSPRIIVQMEDLLVETQMALYTPVHSEHDMKATLAKAEDLLKALRSA